MSASSPYDGPPEPLEYLSNHYRGMRDFLIDALKEFAVRNGRDVSVIGLSKRMFNQLNITHEQSCFFGFDDNTPLYLFGARVDLSEDRFYLK